MFKSVIWASSIDFPEHIATVLFVGKCNWACSYCHNKALASLPSINFREEIIPRLIERKSLVNRVVISGGEPTIYEELPEVIKHLREEGFHVGLHTNGSNPEMITKVIDMLEFIGMDLKTSAEGYRDTIFKNMKNGIMVNNLAAVPRSAEIIAENTQITSEFRTTILPSVTTPGDIKWVAKYLKSLNIDHYVLQQFNNKFMDVTEELEQYNEATLENIIKDCNKILPTTIRK